jgi:hypothetical protein
MPAGNFCRASAAAQDGLAEATRTLHTHGRGLSRDAHVGTLRRLGIEGQSERSLICNSLPISYLQKETPRLRGRDCICFSVVSSAQRATET